jgi:hypothetical protein
VKNTFEQKRNKMKTYFVSSKMVLLALCLASSLRAHGDMLEDEVTFTAKTLSAPNPVDHGRLVARIAILESQSTGKVNLTKVQWALKKDSLQFGHPDAWYQVAYNSFLQQYHNWLRTGSVPQ